MAIDPRLNAVNATDSQCCEDSITQDMGGKMARPVMTKPHVAAALIIVARDVFFRGCLHRGLKEEWPGEIVSCASLSELTEAQVSGPPTTVMLSTISLAKNEADVELGLLADLGPGWRCMILAETDDLDAVLAALAGGAKGYISTSAEFPVFVEALRFIAAGGTYVPAQCLFAARQAPTAREGEAAKDGITGRELAVVRAIRQGKPNKLIAYELGMCESTVKVHVRHVMRKLHARNRTEIAVKFGEQEFAPFRGELNAMNQRQGAATPKCALIPG